MEKTLEPVQLCEQWLGSKASYEGALQKLSTG